MHSAAAPAQEAARQHKRPKQTTALGLVSGRGIEKPWPRLLLNPASTSQVNLHHQLSPGICKPAEQTHIHASGANSKPGQGLKNHQGGKSGEENPLLLVFRLLS